MNCLMLRVNRTSHICTVFEDNQAALILASATDPPRLTPRSKSIAVKYHWFRSHLKPGEIEIKSIPSLDQKANIMTKPLTEHSFRRERQMIMGWTPEWDQPSSKGSTPS